MDEALNLKVQRGDRSVWDPPAPTWRVRAEDRERLMTIACGSTLAMLGARKRGFAGGLIAAAGGAIAMRALMGRHDMNVARVWIDRAMHELGWRRHEIVDDSSEESFPASDPPPWTGSQASTKGS